MEKLKKQILTAHCFAWMGETGSTMAPWLDVMGLTESDIDIPDKSDPLMKDLLRVFMLLYATPKSRESYNMKKAYQKRCNRIAFRPIDAKRFSPREVKEACELAVIFLKAKNKIYQAEIQALMKKDCLGIDSISRVKGYRFGQIFPVEPTLMTKENAKPPETLAEQTFPTKVIATGTGQFTGINKCSVDDQPEYLKQFDVKSEWSTNSEWVFENKAHQAVSEPSNFTPIIAAEIERTRVANRIANPNMGNNFDDPITCVEKYTGFCDRCRNMHYSLLENCLGCFESKISDEEICKAWKVFDKVIRTVETPIMTISKFCPKRCKYLSCTEEEQDKTSLPHKPEHLCLRHQDGISKQKLYHLADHPEINKCKQCLKESINERTN